MIARHPDTTYQRRMWDLRRRALLVRTDSLARLYATLFTVPDSMTGVVRQATGCESYHLIALHGPAVGSRAMDGMDDSLKRAGMDLEQHETRMATAKGPELELSRAACGAADDSLPVLPDSLRNDPEPGPVRRQAPE
jgi:hypothetical protein